jgi:hypothetical protein
VLVIIQSMSLTSPKYPISRIGTINIMAEIWFNSYIACCDVTYIKEYSLFQNLKDSSQYLQMIVLLGR